MSDEIVAAFAHPEVRAAQTAGANPPDRISLRDHIAAAEIGAFQGERGETQRLRFNIVVELQPHRGAASDDVDDILSYDRLSEAVAAELAAERLNLLETLAERVAERILGEPQATRVFVRVEKLDRGPGALGVEVVRARQEQPVKTRHNPPPAPVVVWFTGPVADLEARLARLEPHGAPFIIALAPPDLPRPRSQDARAQRQIELLAIEQAAWALAARDARLSVVATRTEIDWALRQGHMIVWAPSKLMSDTPGAPDQVGDGLGPALWLAALLGARKLLLPAGTDLPDGGPVPLEYL